jgi:hypothetical protein
LVSLDASSELPLARAGRRASAPAAPVTVAAAAPAVHQPCQDVAATFRELPAISDVDLPALDRCQEIDGLRTALGLHVEEPASNESQVSAMVINLEASKPSPSGGAATPAAVTARPVLVNRPLNRPIEERQHLPQLSAPRQASDSVQASNLPSRHSRLVHGSLLALVLIAAALTAVWLGR